ncbi:unnamed protein product [Bemisia tabaci]|uniref:Uncharacterized protein n=1 Tax=Bemisia tabaci TaxID=7038 RepID=A0A9P0AM67_BEMTA|nr:unnamed protein product [Bemisia tabaci]
MSKRSMEGKAAGLSHTEIVGYPMYVPTRFSNTKNTYYVNINGVSSGDEDDDGLSAGPDSPGIPFSPTSSLKTGSVGLDPDNDDDDDNASLASDGHISILTSSFPKAYSEVVSFSDFLLGTSLDGAPYPTCVHGQPSVRSTFSKRLVSKERGGFSRQLVHDSTDTGWDARDAVGTGLRDQPTEPKSFSKRESTMCDAPEYSAEEDEAVAVVRDGANDWRGHDGLRGCGITGEEEGASVRSARLISATICDLRRTGSVGFSGASRLRVRG